MFILNDDNQLNYKIISSKYLAEQNLEVVEIEHIKTSAKIILFICDDDNRVFNIAFKTPVDNSKGTPHILEHSVLCGSRKYNIKDPFIELAKGSMNTFLNAMTFPDKTCYPVASANLKDFHNLIDVYLDAVFYPNAIKNKKIFMQEGWHYELDNIHSNLQVNGVVYNEMKGVYSDPDSILESAIFENLFQGTNYAFESGGNPLDIIDLSFDEFVSFHKKYYSASNSTIYFYGKLDFNLELLNLHNNYLKDFNNIEVDSKFKLVENVDSEHYQENYYNVDSLNDDNKSYIAYSFALPFKKSSLQNIVMQIIDYVLFSSESAVLKEKLMNEGFGESISSLNEAGLNQGFYSIVSQNINQNKKTEFVKTIKLFIENLVNNGLCVDKFKAGINSLYFDYAEGEFGRLPRGLYLSLISLDTYLCGGEPYTYLEYKDAFDYIKKVDLQSKNNIFVNTLREVFLDNKHTSINLLIPKVAYSKEKDDQLSHILSDRQKMFNNSQLNAIIDEMNDLKKYQKESDSIDDINSIPMLKVSDIDRDKVLIDYDVDTINNIEAVVSTRNDKDIVYIGVRFELSNFSKEEIYLVSAINNLLSKIDLDTMSFHEFNNYIGINTGGIFISVETFENKSFLSLSIKVTKEKINIAFEILYKLISETNFKDKKRINLLFNEVKSNSLLAVLSSGHIAAMARSKSIDEYSSSILDKVSITGIGFYKFINSLCNVYEINYELINDTLDLLFRKIISSKMYFSVCTNKNYYDDIKREFNTFAEKINIIKNSNKNTEEINNKLQRNIEEIKKIISFDDFDKKVRREAILTPNDINFCAISGKFEKKYYSGWLFVLRTLFNYEYLWTNIRVLGGAYGCMSSFARSGNYSLVSYRDPNVSKTNKVFLGVKAFLDDIHKSSDEINKYIIGSIGGFDNPVSVIEAHKRNIAAFFNKIDDKEYNKFRHDILDMKANDLNKLSDIFNDIDSASECALISANKLEEAKKEYDIVWQLME